ncbi:succinate dehydrogenase [Flavobacterium sp. 316]|uniref:succinate dehydrogenase cytochrome b subunit n=1 Tax=Flavobacterium sp. 316 TaxID=1603293 RepID=UPI0005E08019|nr:succinate dehydrogenase cytochrome b subunit [Flavobacterium sp. 316]KIX20680.1 succinate dehydrogenase [Flavobacterium sp. 316]
MAKSALLKSSIAKKYWMALTGLFLCLFLAGHLAGNLQLLVPNNALNFNQYALFMTTNPAVKLLSYLTYISIIFHAIDGILLAFQNKAARPINYAKTSPSANSSFASRNMAVLGTIILVFIVTHMVNFWAKMHFDKNIPLASKEVVSQMGKTKMAIGVLGSQNPFFPLDSLGKLDKNILESNKLQVLDVTKVIAVENNNDVVFEGYKDLYKITYDFFRDAKYGLLFTIGYVLAMLALGFHLWHGFQSAFQSLGINNKFTLTIKFIGRAFAVIVPLLFAIIPLYIHFTK